MYIVAIAWIYVTLLMALTETSVTAGLLTFLLYGAGPLAIFVYIFGTPWRKARRRARASMPVPDQPADALDRRDPERDQ